MVKRRGLTGSIFVAICLGAVIGLICHPYLGPYSLSVFDEAMDLVSSIFIHLIQMLIAPLVLTTLISGIARIGKTGSAGRIAAQTMAWFIVASLLSLAVGVVAVVLLKPGVGLHLQIPTSDVALKQPPLTLISFIGRLVPTSIFDAMAHNEVLQIVVFGLVAGMALARFGDDAETLVRLSDSLSKLMLSMAALVMYTAPFAVFAAVAKSLADQGVSIIATYASYVGGFYVALTFLWALMLLAGSLVIGPSRQWTLLRRVRQPALIALATTSSEAAYPVLLQKLEDFGVPNKIASFVLPLGYSFNLIGSMCYCAFAALFTVQAYDIKLSHLQIGQLLFLLFITSKGIANVPRASLLVVAAILPYFGIPDAAIVLILGVDHFLDMGRTATNTVANAIAAATVADWNRLLQP